MRPRRLSTAWSTGALRVPVRERGPIGEARGAHADRSRGLTGRPVGRPMLTMGCAHRLGSLGGPRAVWPALAAGLACMLAAPAPVHAQDPDPVVLHPLPRAKVTAALEYHTGPGGRPCADEEWFRALLAALMGYDPFDPTTAGLVVGAVRVLITGSPGGVRGTFTYTGTNLIIPG